MKRFTETEKWRDPWFMGLTTKQKLLWQYMLDHCDNAGVLDLSKEHAEFSLRGEKIDWVGDLEPFNGRVTQLETGKLWIHRFVEFQCGELSEDCRPHQQVISLLKKHGLWKGYQKGIDTHIYIEQDKDKKRTGGSGGKPSVEECRQYASELEMPSSEGEDFWHHHEARGWRLKTGPMVSWKSAMVTWKKNWKAGAFTHQKHENNGVTIRTPLDADNVLRAIQGQIEAIQGNRTNWVKDDTSPKGYRYSDKAREEIRALVARRDEVKALKAKLS